MLKRILAGLIVAVVMASGAAAEPFEDGLAAYHRGDYAAAVKLWRPLADQGDLRGQTFLGLMYFNGQGVPQDYDEAAKWLRSPAEQGVAPAQSLLGTMHLLGQGVAQDDAEAFKWFHLAAAQGYPDAEAGLGVMYATGRGVERDDAEALRWDELAMKGGQALPKPQVSFLQQQIATLKKQIAAAATEEPINCKSAGQEAVARPPERLEMIGFSIVPPDGQNWCTKGPNAFHSAVVFYKETNGGKKPSKVSFDEVAHTFLAFASRSDVKGKVPKNTDELLAFANRLQEAGGTTKQLSGKRLLDPSHVVTPAVAARSVPTRTSISSDTSLGLDCVRIDTATEDRANPRFPGTVLVEEDVGYLCLDPGSRRDLIEIAYSERYAKDRRPGLSLMESLRPEVEPFLKSLQLLPPRDKTAVKGFLSAAERGLAQAQFSLGVMYETERNYPEAIKWYGLAANQGFAAAQFNLAVLHVENQNYVRARMWFDLAAASWANGPDAGQAVERRDLIAKIMTAEQIADSERLVREWKPVAK